MSEENKMFALTIKPNDWIEGVVFNKFDFTYEKVIDDTIAFIRKRSSNPEYSVAMFSVHPFFCMRGYDRHTGKIVYGEQDFAWEELVIENNDGTNYIERSSAEGCLGICDDDRCFIFTKDILLITNPITKEEFNLNVNKHKLFSIRELKDAGYIVKIIGNQLYT